MWAGFVTSLQLYVGLKPLNSGALGNYAGFHICILCFSKKILEEGKKFRCQLLSISISLPSVK